MKHSGLGIASFSLSIVTGILTFLAFMAAGVMATAIPGGVDEESLSAILLGFAFIAFLGLTVVALALGIASLFQKERQKIFGTLGTIFSTIIIVGTSGLIVWGSSMD